MAECNNRLSVPVRRLLADDDDEEEAGKFAVIDIFWGNA